MRALVAVLLMGAAQIAAAQDHLARVHGRLVDPEGAPVAGAELTLHGWPANDERTQAHGVPENWADPTPVTSDAEGRFEVACRPPRAFQFTLKATHPDYGRVGWRWGELQPRRAVDLGTTKLEPPAALVGYIVDPEGNLLVEGWRVSAWHSWNSPMGGRSTQGSHAPVDPQSGTFRIDDLPPGKLRLSAQCTSGARIDEVWFKTVRGARNEVELVFDGPDMRRRIVLTTSTDVFRDCVPEPGDVQLVDVDGSRRPLTLVEGYGSRFEADGLEPGAYALEIDDPRLEPWRMEGVHTGTTTRARLAGNVSLRLAVHDPDSDQPVRAYGLRVEYFETGWHPSRFVLAEDRAQAPPGGLHHGLVPGQCTLEVRVEGCTPELVPLGVLTSGETRELEVEIGRGQVLTGRVQHPDGSPAAGARVEITRGEIPGGAIGSGTYTHTVQNADGTRTTYEIRPREAEATTDADGRFRFDTLGADTYALRACVGEWILIDEVVRLGEAHERDLSIHVPPTGAIELHLTLPDGLEPERVLAFLRSTDPHAIGLGMRGGPEGVHVVAGETTRRALAPTEGLLSSVAIAVRVDDDERPRLAFELLPVAPDGGALKFEELQRGTWRVHDVPSATWRLRALHHEGGWAWELPEPLVLVPASKIPLNLAIELVTRRLRVLDVGGAPLARAPIVWWSEGADSARASKWTDDAGERELALPAGRYCVAREGSEAAYVGFTWEAGADAVEVVLPGSR